MVGKDLAQGSGLVLVVGLWGELAVLKDAHDNGSCTVSALVLSKIVRARELLSTFSALEGLVVSVKRAVMAFEMFLAAEATIAQGADKGLRGIFGQGLLAAATVNRL